VTFGHVSFDITLSSEKDRDMATINVYRKFRDVWACEFWYIWADRQTGRQIIQTYIPTDKYRHIDRIISHPSREQSKHAAIVILL